MRTSDVVAAIGFVDVLVVTRQTSLYICGRGEKYLNH